MSKFDYCVQMFKGMQEADLEAKLQNMGDGRWELVVVLGNGQFIFKKVRTSELKPS